ncbi:hypothetical protein NAC44_04270 [Allorhizobium sp. BGMRC 0089]|uniref:hypothetical protein n=1 Tax=Allorhizobium sonneratiae TaxID=2934936 RepID=UPI0020340F12|nr:hypothetical protein [Allorhizobium sonneratiae]MCM2291542.1 hypothetical protein [Allorhizobium sonneratiae]
MSGLEAAIRNALERSDRARADVRARIYQSARQALESSLKKKNVTDPDSIADQRHRLEATIHAIEQEERQRLSAKPGAGAEKASPEHHQVTGASRQEPVGLETSAMAPEHDAGKTAHDDGEPAKGQHDDDGSLSFGVERKTAADAPGPDLEGLRAERDKRNYADSQPQLSVPVDTGEKRQPVRTIEEARREKSAKKRPRKQKRRRSLLGSLFITAVLLSFAGICLWWALSTGLVEQALNGDGGLFDDAAGNGDGGQLKTLDPQRGFSSQWLVAFTPADVKRVTARPNATIDVVNASDGQALQIQSKSSDADGEAVLTLPDDIFAQMAAKNSTIAITVQAAGSKPVQFSVSCSFGDLGSCDRHRFTVFPEKTDLLFHVTLSQAAMASGQARLFINSDMSGSGQGLDLYTVRVLPGQ